MAINLHPTQSDVFRELFIDKTARFMPVACSRGWGKSYLGSVAAITAIFELIELEESVPNKNVYIIAPTYDQVVDIYYPLINFELGIEHFALKSSRDTGRFLFSKNVELRLISYESVERMRGKGAYFVVWDEVSSCKKGIKPKEAWTEVIKPCMSTRWSPKRAAAHGAKSPGRALIIGTTKGYNYFDEMLNMQEKDDEWQSHRYTYLDSPLLDQEEIEKQRKNMDAVSFASEYLAESVDSGNRVFHCFDRKVHVRKDLEYFQDGEIVNLGIDFNVGIQATSAFAIRGGQVHFLDEFKGFLDTGSLAEFIVARYKGHEIRAFPDPTGRSRKTSAPIGITDFKLLELAGIKCFARKKSPPIADSVSAVNRMMMDATGAVNFYVAAGLDGLIESLEKTKWVENNPDAAMIDKSEGIEHYSDGVRYPVEFLFPIIKSSCTVVKGRKF